MSELSFDHPLDGGEKLLSEFVSGLMLFKGWEIVKRGVCQKMQEYMPEEHPLIEGLDMDTKFLMVPLTFRPVSLGLKTPSVRWKDD